jgi:hypothetical protein
MATKQGNPAFAFLLNYLKKHRKAVFADCKRAAGKSKHEIWPIMFGRAQAILGIVKSAKRGEGRYAKAKNDSAKKAAISKSRQDGRGMRTDILSSVRALHADRDRLLAVLNKVRGIVVAALDN